MKWRLFLWLPFVCFRLEVVSAVEPSWGDGLSESELLRPIIASIEKSVDDLVVWLWIGEFNDELLFGDDLCWCRCSCMIIAKWGALFSAELVVISKFVMSIYTESLLLVNLTNKQLI